MILISEATEARILQVTEHVGKDWLKRVPVDQSFLTLLSMIEDDLSAAERIEGDIHVY